VTDVGGAWVTVGGTVVLAGVSRWGSLPHAAAKTWPTTQEFEF
jgi:hypothetical protein